MNKREEEDEEGGLVYIGGKMELIRSVEWNSHKIERMGINDETAPKSCQTDDRGPVSKALKCLK